jgi:AcrR family transcriptional regulator
MMAPSAPLDGPALFRHPLAAAVMEVLAERGYPAATVDQFFARAGLDPAEFEARPPDKADLVLRVFHAYIADFEAKVRSAYAAAPSWPDNLRAAAYEVTRWMRDHPAAAWFGMVGVLEAGEMGRVMREDVFRWCAQMIDDGRTASPHPESVPLGAPLLAVGAVAEILTRQLQGTIIADPIETVPKLMYGAVRPYLGEEAARRELAIPPPPDLALPTA